MVLAAAGEIRRKRGGSSRVSLESATRTAATRQRVKRAAKTSFCSIKRSSVSDACRARVGGRAQSHRLARLVSCSFCFPSTYTTQSRTMKSDKAKETLSKLGLKKVEGVQRVVIKKPKGVRRRFPPRTQSTSNSRPQRSRVLTTAYTGSRGHPGTRSLQVVRLARLDLAHSAGPTHNSRLAGPFRIATSSLARPSRRTRRPSPTLLRWVSSRLRPRLKRRPSRPALRLAVPTRPTTARMPTRPASKRTTLTSS